jgi:hypothetical protein
MGLDGAIRGAGRNHVDVGLAPGRAIFVPGSASADRNAPRVRRKPFRDWPPMASADEHAFAGGRHIDIDRRTDRNYEPGVAVGTGASLPLI